MLFVSQLEHTKQYQVPTHMDYAHEQREMNASFFWPCCHTCMVQCKSKHDRKQIYPL